MPAVTIERGAEEFQAVIGADDPGERWDAFVASHPAGHLMQSRAWAGARRETGWRPLFLRLEDAGGIRAAALVLRRGLPGTGLALLYMPRGPVLDYDDPVAVEALGAALRRLGEDQRALLMQADPAVPEDREGAHRALEQMGFLRQERQGLFRILQPRWVMRIPLERYGGPEGLLAALPHKTRYNIGLARRKGVTVTFRTDAEACRAFHRLLWAAGRSKGFPVRGLGFHEALWRHCVRPGFGEYLFAEQEGRLLAAIQVLRFGPRAWYMYGASTEEDRNLMPTYLLQWEAICRAWAAGCRCYDMRGVYSGNPQPDHPEYGVYDFKRKFNAELVRFLGEYDLVARPRACAIWRRLEAAAQRPAAWAFRLRQRLGGPR
jgi:lipid II:glycine glycyltransferase (peptidoglycan interpeptide bridge formation enzyme)